MSRVSPREQSYEAVLEDKDNSNAKNISEDCVHGEENAYRELNDRKFLDMRPTLKLGRSTYLRERRSG